MKTPYICFSFVKCSCLQNVLETNSRKLEAIWRELWNLSSRTKDVWRQEISRRRILCYEETNMFSWFARKLTFIITASPLTSMKYDMSNAKMNARIYKSQNELSRKIEPWTRQNMRTGNIWSSLCYVIK